MKGRIIRNWNEVQYDSQGVPTKEAQEKIAGALQYFLSMPDRFIPAQFMNNDKYKKAKEAQFQALTTGSDFPANPQVIIEKFHGVPVYDNGYESIFDVRDYSGTIDDGFTMSDVTSGLVFRKVEPGDTADVYQASGTRVRVFFDYYAGALSWHRSLFQTKNYWTLEDNAIEFRAKAYQRRAAIHYALIDALPAARNIVWQPPDPATLPNTDAGYNANRDAQTLNAAALNIINACQNKGYEFSAENVNFIVLYPIALKSRLRKAASITMSTSFKSDEKEIAYDFTFLGTTMLAANNVYYVILPKRKIKTAYKMDLTLFSDFDILRYSDVSAGWMAYGGAIGDTDQLMRCATA